MVVQVSFLVLGAQHVHHLAVLRGAGGTLCVALCVAVKAVLVERVAAQEVDGGQLQGTVAHAALGLLEDLCTFKEVCERSVNIRYQFEYSVWSHCHVFTVLCAVPSLPCGQFVLSCIALLKIAKLKTKLHFCLVSYRQSCNNSVTVCFVLQIQEHFILHLNFESCKPFQSNYLG